MAQEMILAKLSQLQSFGEKFLQKLRTMGERVSTLEEAGGQKNLIERILLNGELLGIDENKSVDIPVPTKVTQLENDASYKENVIETVQVNGSARPVNGKTVNIPVPTKLSELANDEERVRIICSATEPEEGNVLWMNENWDGKSELRTATMMLDLDEPDKGDEVLAEIRGKDYAIDNAVLNKTPPKGKYSFDIL